jgi:NADPH:quinone reductase-like Zn-dependent oxidoreductase
MKTALIRAFGGPDVVTLADIDLREVQANEIAVRVEAAAVNPLDLKMIAGAMQQVFPSQLPYVPGTDFSGAIEAVGNDVEGMRIGDRVVGRTAPGVGGAFGKRLVIAADQILPIPDGMNFEQAAALPTAFGTARQALFDVGALQAGETVLVHAGAGGVGGMAVQLAHSVGARVLATASERNHELVRSLGADEVIDYRTQDFSALRDVDLVLDTLGGDTLEKSWKVLRAGGRIVTTVDFSITERDGHAGTFVFFAGAVPYLPQAFSLFERGQLQIVTDAIFKLDDVRSALERQASGHARGKLIVRVGQ